MLLVSRQGKRDSGEMFGRNTAWAQMGVCADETDIRSGNLANGDEILQWSELRTSWNQGRYAVKIKI